MTESEPQFEVYEVTGVKFSEDGDVDKTYLKVFSDRGYAKKKVEQLIRHGYDLYDLSPIDVY